MGVLRWLDRMILSHRRPHVQEAMRNSDDLLATKRRMTRFSDDLQSGRIVGQHKVLNIDQGDFLDDELFGERKGKP